MTTTKLLGLGLVFGGVMLANGAIRLPGMRRTPAANT
jgi:hypothetical protein